MGETLDEEQSKSEQSSGKESANPGGAQPIHLRAVVDIQERKQTHPDYKQDEGDIEEVEYKGLDNSSVEVAVMELGGEQPREISHIVDNVDPVEDYQDMQATAKGSGTFAEYPSVRKITLIWSVFEWDNTSVRMNGYVPCGLLIRETVTRTSSTALRARHVNC